MTRHRHLLHRPHHPSLPYPRIGQLRIFTISEMPRTMQLAYHMLFKPRLHLQLHPQYPARLYAVLLWGTSEELSRLSRSSYPRLQNVVWRLTSQTSCDTTRETRQASWLKTRRGDCNVLILRGVLLEYLWKVAEIIRSGPMKTETLSTSIWGSSLTEDTGMKIGHSCGRKYHIQETGRGPLAIKEGQDSMLYIQRCFGGLT